VTDSNRFNHPDMAFRVLLPKSDTADHLSDHVLGLDMYMRNIQRFECDIKKMRRLCRAPIWCMPSA
ncbi:6015_t:CDS:1, partial [Gigaspora margarita]